VQAADDTGWVTFTSIFPGAYPGGWPHVHFEVYPSVAQAMNSADRLHTGRLALPADACATAYATTGYAVSKANLATEALAGGRPLEMPTVTGDVRRGFVATRTVAM
jgi:protocatechuate 3,4-dioxygenase beta subunit